MNAVMDGPSESLEELETAACWRALEARDTHADDRFVYAVRTTGIYCRPSCPSRRPRRENVDFFADARAAEAAGFRACKRCLPDGRTRESRYADAVARACALIEAAETPPDLTALAGEANLSPYHFHRIFKRLTGLTPRAYAAAARKARVRAGLGQGVRVTDAAFSAGFNSSGRFYAASRDALGMSPSAYRAGGAGQRIRFAVAQCRLGALLVAATEVGLCAISLGDDPEALVHELEDRFHGAELVGGDDAFEDLVARVVTLVEAPTAPCDLPLDIRGTAFQERVWQALRNIPPGETVSYSQLAERIGRPRAVRAVASACAANVLAVAIPCHRVVRTDGSLSGYRWGIERKRTLLELEREA